MKKLFALVLVVFVGLGVFIWVDPFGYAGNLDLQQEERLTRLQVTQGEVLVNGQVAVDGQILSPGDQIETTSATQASILYFDDSVTRLSAETKVRLKVLDSDEFYSGKAEIELVVEDGEAWTNVPPQTAKEYLFGVSTRDVHATIRGTTLNVLVESETSVVQAANHSVEVRASVDLRAENTLVLKEGEEIEYGKIVEEDLSEGEEPEKKLGVKRVIPQASLQRDWFSQNQQEDRLYEKNLLSERLEKQRQNVGALPGTFGYRLKKAKETLVVQMASEEEKERLEQAVLERRFTESQLLKAAGDDEAAQKQSDAAKAELQKVSQTNPKLAQEILIRQQEVVKTALPGDAAYFLKTELRVLESQVASDDDRELIEERQLQRKILELHDATKGGNAPDADLESQRNALQTEVRALPQEKQRNILPSLPYILEEAEVEEIAPEPAEEAPENFGTLLSEEEIAQLEAEVRARAEAEALVEIPLVEEEILTENEETTPEAETTTSSTINAEITVTPGGTVRPIDVVPNGSSNTVESENQDTFDQIQRDLFGQ